MGRPPLTIRLLGALSVTAGERTVEIPSRKARALLAIIVLRGAQGVARSTVAELLWGDRADAQARASLRQSLAELRSGLGDASTAIEAGKEALRWMADGASVDLDRLRSPQSSADDEEWLLSCGELLEGFHLAEPSFEHWLAAERAKTGAMVLAALRDRMVERMRTRDLDAALALGLRSIAIDPLQEQIQRDVMTILAQMGRTDAALASYERFKADLARHLGVAPERETDDIAREIRTGRRTGIPPKATSPTSPDIPRDIRPSIAILPFVDLTGGDGHAHLAKGLTDDIFDTLSRVSELVVVASVSRPAQGALAAEHSLQEIPASHALEGSLRLAGSTLRVSARLLNTATGEQVWSERFDGDLGDVFAFQDDVARKVAVGIQVALTFGDAARLWHGQTKNVQAWQAAVRARAAFNRYTTADNYLAERLLREAIALDPGYTAAMVDLGICYYWRARYVISADREEAMAAAQHQASLVDRLDPELPAANTLRAFLALMNGQHDEAVYHAAKACRLWPTDARAATIAGVIHLYADNLRESGIALAEAMRLSPYPESAVYYALALGDLWQGRLDLARDRARRHNDLQPGDPHGLVYEAIIHGARGDKAEASRTIRRLASTASAFGLRHLLRSELYRDADKRDAVISAAKELGLQD